MADDAQQGNAIRRTCSMSRAAPFVMRPANPNPWSADAITSLMRAYRAYVTAHPARYAAMPADPLHQQEYAAPGRRMLDVMQAALRPWQLDENELIHTIRAARVIVHGQAPGQRLIGYWCNHDSIEPITAASPLTVRSSAVAVPVPSPVGRSRTLVSQL